MPGGAQLYDGDCRACCSDSAMGLGSDIRFGPPSLDYEAGTGSSSFSTSQIQVINLRILVCLLFTCSLLTILLNIKWVDTIVTTEVASHVLSVLRYQLDLLEPH